MTSDFKKQLIIAAYEYDGARSYGSTAIHAFETGAQWGYREGIKAAIEMLRNEKAIDDHLGMHERSHDEFADWLEEKFEVNK